MPKWSRVSFLKILKFIKFEAHFIIFLILPNLKNVDKVKLLFYDIESIMSKIGIFQFLQKINITNEIFIYKNLNSNLDFNPFFTHLTLFYRILIIIPSLSKLNFLMENLKFHQENLVIHKETKKYSLCCLHQDLGYWFVVMSI